MALEIERKFLVTSDAWRAQAHSRELLRQGYLESNDRSSIRVRTAGAKAWLNLKAKRSGLSRLEFEYEIPRADADEILDELCKGPRVEKYRHEVRIGPHVWEVDEFLGDNRGLVVAEIELGDEAESFARPDWLGEEVTHEERYYNYNLVTRPYREWR